MSAIPEDYARSSEALIVGLARSGDRIAFEELVRRRQAWIRNLMRRCCGDTVLADDLAQQAFLQAWRDIHKIREPQKFGSWLKHLAINTWRQHLRKQDPLRHADQATPDDHFDDNSRRQTAGIAMDLDRALALLPPQARLCVVLSYHEGMSHSEIAHVTGMPTGTVKSHIRRGTETLKTLLSAYEPTSSGGKS